MIETINIAPNKEFLLVYGEQKSIDKSLKL